MSEAIRYNVGLMRRDMAIKGWMQNTLAKRARVADSTVGRFLDGSQQTAKMCKRLARALGHDVERYLVDEQERVSA